MRFITKDPDGFGKYSLVGHSSLLFLVDFYYDLMLRLSYFYFFLNKEHVLFKDAGPNNANHGSRM